jgi:tetratricopeptide (TPR) repeat protein
MLRSSQESTLADERQTFVARESDLQRLRAAWGVRLQAPFGGGRRALSAEFLRGLAEDDDVVLWRVSCLDQENGLQWLVRMYGSLLAALTRDVLRRGKVEMILNTQLPSQPARVQGWYQQFITAMKESKTDKETGQIQLRMPQENPLIGLAEVVAAISRRMPIVLELQSPYVANTLGLPLLCEAMHAEARAAGGKLLQILFDEPDSEVTKSVHPMGLLDFYERAQDSIEVQTVAPWGAQEVGQYLASKDLQGDAARMAEITQGRPGFVAELVDILIEREQLHGDLSAVSFGSLVPMNIDEDELEEAPDQPTAEGERRHATAADVGRVTYLAALLGAAFPATLVADMGGFERDSIDDLLDAMPDLFEEVQFSQDLGSWIYRFKRGSYREGILELNATEEGHELARRVAVFMERFLVPRGYGFLVKTARIYAEHGAPNRATLLRAMALSQDASDMWGLAYDFTRYFDEIRYPDAMLRTVYTNLLENLASGGNLQLADRVQTEVTEWATQKQDRDLEAWLLFNGSKLDLRRQDLFRARDRANDALRLYDALGNKARMADVRNHLATIELQGENLEAALEHAAEAEKLASVQTEDGKTGVIPGVMATAEQIRGVVQRRRGQLPGAIEHFRRANQIAGEVGLAQLALDAGLSFGEALLFQALTTGAPHSEVEKARDALERVLNISRGVRSPGHERRTSELLAQAEAGLREWDKAIPHSLRALELTRLLKLENSIPIDLFTVGLLYSRAGKPAEALPYFNQSAERVGILGPHPVVRELHFHKGRAHLEVGQLPEAKRHLEAAAQLQQDTKEWRGLCSSLEGLAEVEQRSANPAGAKAYLERAVEAAGQADLREERKNLKKKLDALA